MQTHDGDAGFWTGMTKNQQARLEFKSWCKDKPRTASYGYLNPAQGCLAVSGGDKELPAICEVAVRDDDELNTLLAIGGTQDARRYMTSVEAVHILSESNDEMTCKWQVPDLPEPLAFARAFLVRGVVHVCGGYGGRGPARGQRACYFFHERKWEWFTKPRHLLRPMSKYETVEVDADRQLIFNGISVWPMSLRSTMNMIQDWHITTRCPPSRSMTA